MLFDYESYQDWRSNDDAREGSFDFLINDYCHDVDNVIKTNPIVDFTDKGFPEMIEPPGGTSDVFCPSQQIKIKCRRNKGIKPPRKYEKKQVG